MDLTKYYPDIAAKYPAYVTQRELCEICRICPKTAYNLEQQGEIPYTIEQNHLIRSHKIKLTDILAYLYRRECRQEADSPYICAMRTFYDKHLSPYTTEVGTSALGAITRIEHLAERIPGYLKEAQRELEEVQKQLAVAQQQVGQPFIYEDELSEKVAQLTEINTKLEFESLQESEVILDENGQRSDGEEDWDSERVPSCASAEV